MARKTKRQHLSDADAWNRFLPREQDAIEELDTLFDIAKAILKHHFPETSPTLDQILEVVVLIQQETEKDLRKPEEVARRLSFSVSDRQQEFFIAAAFLVARVGFFVEDVEVSGIDPNTLPNYKALVGFYKIAAEKLNQVPSTGKS